MRLDYSTLNLDALGRRPLYTKPPTYRIGDHLGSGCFGDPPGYPSYFLQAVYTQHGNSPRRGAETVIVHPGLGCRIIQTAGWEKGEDWDQRYARFQALLRSLWAPLPLDHPRTRAWIIGTYQHHRHCYRDPRVSNPRASEATLIYPVPSYKLKSPTIDPHWTEEYKAAVRQEAEQYNAMVQADAAAIAVPDNHSAVVGIRQYYPEYQPEPDLIADPGQYARPGDWWEREAEPPTAQQCQPPKWFGAHRTEGWCQYCGLTDNQ